MEKDFAQTTNACLGFIQEALLKHQWQHAAEYMQSYLQILEDSDGNKRLIAPEVWRNALGGMTDQGGCAF